MPYLDIELKARTDGQFRSRLQGFSSELERLEPLALRHEKFAIQYQDTLLKFLEFCQFNLALLTPYYFPRYPKDQPLNFKEYPFSFALFNFEIGSSTTVRGSRQISKSTALGARQLLNAKFIPGFSSMYLTPRSDQLATYANKLREMERAERFWHADSSLRKNLCYKEFPNGSKIELFSVNTTAAGIRGKSSDEICIDEAQGFDSDLETEVAEVRAASQINIQFYSGTSLTTDTYLEHKYATSSAASWIMKCGCGHYNIPDLDHKVLDMIQPHGPACVKCGRLLDVRQGEFVHANQQAFSLAEYGYHIPQLIVPAVVYHPMRWDEIYKKKISGHSVKFLQEILGIPTEEGEREITKKQLQAICTLGGNLQVLHKKAKARKYQFVVSGCDWGGSDYNPDINMKASTTVHAVLGITPDGFFDIIHFYRYYGMGYEEIIAKIIADHKDLNAWAIGSDVGVGALYNSKLREHLPTQRHIMWQYTGPQTAMVAEPKTAHQPNTWNLNKTESISMTYDAVRNKRIRCYDWSLAEPFLQDFLNLYRAPGEKKGESGLSTFLYRAHPTKTTDALMAVNYAFMLGKILIGEPLVPDLSLRNMLQGQLLAGLNYMAGSGAEAYSG